ncbi:MAG: twin-arginine translocase subunit TatC [Pirellulaceae bacterium]
MARKSNDDLFEGSTMSFGDHLEELRVCLFRSVVGIGVGCVVGFLIANSVVRFFQSPLEQAMERYYIENALVDVVGDYGELTYEIRRIILDEKLVPAPLQIDASRLAETLRLTYPERFSGLEISTYWMTAGDLLPGGAKTIAGELHRAAKARSASREKQLWNLLEPNQQQTVSGLATAQAELSRAQVAQLLTILNDVAGQRGWHESAELTTEAGPDAATALAIRTALAKKFDPEQSRRLNKLLIADMFPGSLKPARVNLLQLFTWQPVKIKFQTLNAQEPFMIWMKAALMTGLTLASPYIFYQIWMFVAAGLYPHEKNHVYIYLPLSLLLFAAGASLAFLFVFEPVLDFLFTFNRGMNAEFEPRIGEWLGFVLILPIGFGVGFQLPLVMLFVNRVGLITLETYIAQWRIAVLVIFIVAMILTPAEPISMTLMAGPLCLLYLVGIGMCKYMPKGRSPFAEAYEP